MIGYLLSMLHNYFSKHLDVHKHENLPKIKCLIVSFREIVLYCVPYCFN